MFSRMKRTGLRALIAVAALLGLLVSAAPALASTAQLQKWGVEYIAGPGEANRVIMTLSTTQRAPAAVAISDVGARITPVWPWGHAWGCERIGNPKATDGPVWCAIEEADSMISANLGDLDDRFFLLFPVTSLVDGGAGNDYLFGGDATSTIWGRDGNDVLLGGGGNDWLNGGPGTDSLEGGTGTDDLTGGTGTDTADYSTRSVPVKVSLDTLPVVSGLVINVVPGNDGEAGENDNVFMTMENILGGSGDDELIGSNGDNTLQGNAGSDWIVGNGGNDNLEGGAGLDGLNGGDGNDMISAQDGEYDAIDCGNGVDTAYADLFDTIIGGCEVVSAITIADG
jgi:hemolysin type calcium-binding protein